jgi:hypothetical protein
MTDKFVIFSFPAISTYLNKEGIEKKKPMKMPPWQDIKQTTIKKADKAYAVICGKLSNITVLDTSIVVERLWTSLITCSPN